MSYLLYFGQQGIDQKDNRKLLIGFGIIICLSIYGLSWIF